MKVQLIVVQGKPEGKAIPLAGPVFKIGRGEQCHLRPNSEQVSREHAEFRITGDKVTVRDLGSRNGTLVNGKALTEPATLKDRDLVQIGPLTFAVSIQGTPAAKAPAGAGPRRPASPDDVSHEEIDSWLVADASSPTPERASGIYEGDTITVNAFKDKPPAKPPAPASNKPKAPARPPAPPVPAPEPEPEPEPEPAEDELDDASETMDEIYDKLDEDEEAESGESEGEQEPAPEEFIDESNPFYVKKKGPEAPTPAPGAAKPASRDTSDAASEILRKLMERRRGPK